jgi:hypothetical protein
MVGEEDNWAKIRARMESSPQKTIPISLQRGEAQDNEIRSRQARSPPLHHRLCPPWASRRRRRPSPQRRTDAATASCSRLLPCSRLVQAALLSRSRCVPSRLLGTAGRPFFSWFWCVRGWKHWTELVSLNFTGFGAPNWMVRGRRKFACRAMTETEPDGNDDDKVQYKLCPLSSLSWWWIRHCWKKLILELGGCICTSQANNRFLKCLRQLLLYEKGAVELVFFKNPASTLSVICSKVSVLIWTGLILLSPRLVINIAHIMLWCIICNISSKSIGRRWKIKTFR